MFHSPSSYLLLAILQILQYSCRADAGTINVPPDNLTVALGEIATFSCNGTGFNTRWTINGTNYKTHTDIINEFNFTEYIVGQIDDQRLIHLIYLSFNATAKWNNTEIICNAFTNNIERSQPVFLTIRGGPAVPEVTMTVASSSEMVLRWPVPFTWSDAMITSYDVSASPPINGMSSWSTTSNSLTLLAGPSTPLCIEHLFSVVARNRIGSSGPGIVTGGFPRVPMVTPSPSDITADVRFLQDLTPMLLIKVILPVVCSYQEVEYKVSLQDTKTDKSRTLKATTVTNPTQPVLITVEDNIERDHTYELTVSMTLPGIQEEQQPQPITRPFNTIVLSSVTTLTYLGGVKSKSSLLSMDLVVLICSVSGALVLCLLILSIILLLICHHRRRSRSFRSSGTKSPTTPPMVANPIYEGQPLYETIDSQFRLPMPLPSGPGTCPSPMENPYKNDIGPYSNCPQILAFASPLEEGYTIMTAAREESKNTESNSSGSEQESSGMARYVPDPSLQYASEC